MAAYLFYVSLIVNSQDGVQIHRKTAVRKITECCQSAGVLRMHAGVVLKEFMMENEFHSACFTFSFLLQT